MAWNSRKSKMLGVVWTLLARNLVFTDEKMAWRAELLNNFLLLAIIVDTLAGIANLVRGTAYFTAALVNLGVLFFLLGFFFLVRRNYISPVASFLVLFVWAISSFNLIFVGGIRSPALMAYFIAVLLAGLLLSMRMAILTSLASILVGGGVFWAEMIDRLPRSLVELTPETIGVGLVAVLVVGLLLINILLRRINMSQTMARQELEERVRAEEAGRESEEHFRVLFELAPVGIAIYQDGEYVLANSAAAKLYGARDSSDLTGRPFTDFIHPDYHQAVKERIRQILEEGKIAPLQLQKRIRLDGTMIDVEVAAMPFSYHGRPAVQAVFIDATERKRAEETLRASEEKYRLIIENVDEIVYRVSFEHDPLHGRVEFVSAQVENILGYAPAEFLSDSRLWFQSLHPEDVRRLMETTQQMLSEKTTVTREYRMRHKTTGEYRWMEDKAALLFNANHTIIGYQGAARDITARKRAEQELERRADELGALQETTRDLTGLRDLPELLRAIVARAARLLNAPGGGIYLFDPLRQDVYVATALGSEMTIGARLSLGEGMAGRVAQTREPLIVDDYSSWEGRAPQYVDPPFSAVVEVPMLFRGELIGVLSVHELGKTHRKFTEADTHLLSLFAGQAASAVHNARLFEEIHRRLVEMETLSKISTAMRAAQTTTEMLPLLLDETLVAFDAEAGVIWIYDAAQEHMQQIVARGWFTQLGNTPSAPREEVAGYVFTTGEPYISREFVSDPRARESSRSLIPPGWGGACIPIRTARQIIGVFFISVRLPRQLTATEVHLLTTLAEIAGNAIHRMDLRESLEEMFIQTVAALAHAIDARDRYTGEHSGRVSELAVRVAAEMKMSREDQETIRLGALLHDIGKIAIPDSILYKPAHLLPEEWTLVKKHPEAGAQILEPIQQLKSIVPIVRHHQEKFDGTGYPAGLAGETIPIGSRILSVVDAFSSITDERAYRKAQSKTHAIAEIQRCVGTQFDPRVVEAFLRVLEPRN